MGAPSMDELNKIAEPLFASQKSMSLGPFIVGMILDTLLCGVLLMQCGAYVSLGKNDRPYLKTIVAAITVYTWTWMYDVFVYNFGSYGLLLSLKYLSNYYILDAVTVIVVQAFFAIRAWKVTGRNIFVLGVIATFALAALGGGIAVKVVFTEYGSVLHAADVKIPAYVWLFCTVAADLLITSAILQYLLRGRTGQPTTDSTMSRLVRVTFESQLPPTLIAIGLAVEYTIKYDSFIAIPFICVQAKFYGISLLHTLNSRETLKSVNGTTSMTGDGDIEFARRSHNTFWLSSRIAATAEDNNAARAVKGDTHRHTQFTIIPEPRTRRVKAESLDTVSFKAVDLGPDDDAEADTRKVSEVDLNQGEITELEVGGDPSSRPRRGGGQSKLASMGLTGGIAGMEGERHRDRP
ncbi:transmembrane protein [Ceratobasidium sp. AG-Ba]|nr:transmembrane protein [Ceratobasidium sp. AG-Ba]